MSYYIDHPEIFDQIYLLDRKTISNPITYIYQFTGDHNLFEYRDYIDQIKEVLLTCENDTFSEATDRASINMILINLEKLAEFAFLIIRTRKLLSRMDLSKDGSKTR